MGIEIDIISPYVGFDPLPSCAKSAIHVSGVVLKKSQMMKSFNPKRRIASPETQVVSLAVILPRRGAEDDGELIQKYTLKRIK